MKTLPDIIVEVQAVLADLQALQLPTAPVDSPVTEVDVKQADGTDTVIENQPATA